MDLDLPFVLNLSDPLSRWRAESFWTKERETLRWIEFFAKRFTQSESTLIDVGANIGIYSLYWLSLNVNSQVFSCEPFNPNLTLLKENLVQNNFLARATVIEMPLYSKLQVGIPRILDTRPGGSGYIFEETGGGLSMSREIISSSTVDSIINGSAGPMIMKIDVDGLDYEVLLGAETSLRSGVIKSSLIEATEEIHIKIDDFLSNLGFVADRSFDTVPDHSTIRRVRDGIPERNKVYSSRDNLYPSNH